MSGGVAQPGLELAATNRWAVGSNPTPATNLFSWLPGAVTPDSRNPEGPVKSDRITPVRVILV